MPRPASPRSAADAPVTVAIARIGADGDGAGDGYHVPFTLPGEVVRATPAPRRDAAMASLDGVLTASVDRVVPPCPHFGACGGCSLQHWADAPYADWKSGQVPRALARAGFSDVPIAGLARTPPNARRRIDLAVRRDMTRIVIGLHRARSAEVVDMQACPVLHPALFALVAPLRTLLGTTTLIRRGGSVVLNLLDSGPDLLLRTDAAPDAPSRAALARFASAHGIPRIAWALDDGQPEPVATLGPVSLALSGVPVSPPPGAFLQASPQGERAIVDAVLAGLPRRAEGKLRVGDLYAGIGTLTFPLAAVTSVRAYEGDASAAAALRDGINRAGLAGRATVETRDLVRQPLQLTELKKLDAVVLDPPYAGAADQVALIAAAAVPRVIYVSCNPAALARDSAALRAAGYAALATTPIDQFLWSSRIESVTVFDRPRRRPPGAHFVP